MANHEKKLTLLRLLELENGPISLPNILVKLGSGYFERSVRRWLSEMNHNGLIEKVGQKKATKYLAINPISKNHFSNICYDEVRVRTRAQRYHLIREIILNQLKGETLKNFISHQTSNLIKSEDQALFLEDVYEDLKEIDMSRILVLGIIPDQLYAFKKLSRCNL